METNPPVKTPNTVEGNGVGKNLGAIGGVISALLNWLSKDRRKRLPYQSVDIGKFKQGILVVDIQARIILEEKKQPSAGIFLDRIHLGEAYCSQCLRTLNTLHAHWMADGIQKGYKCQNCEEEIEVYREDIVKDVKGKVRRDYQQYWDKYRKNIEDITGGKPHKFKL